MHANFVFYISDTDPKLVRCKSRLYIRKKRNEAKLPKRLDVSRLKVLETRAEFRIEPLGFVKKHHKHLCDSNEENVKLLLKIGHFFRRPLLEKSS